jgi:predicted dipeptidase
MPLLPQALLLLALAAPPAAPAPGAPAAPPTAPAPAATPGAGAPAAPLQADPRCEGGPRAAASRFSARALPGRGEAERLQAYVSACALPRVVELTAALVAFPTVSSEQPAGKSAAIAGMGAFLERWARTHGLRFRRFGKDDVFELTWGRGPARLGFVLHGDVVPAPAHEWKHPPFEARVVDGRLYGRGVEDDKGPLAAVLVVTAMARELGLSPSRGGSVVVAVGNGEESDWSGMTAYAQAVKHPAHVVSVDADFPVVAAQSGFVSWTLTAPAPAEAPGVAGARPVKGVRVVDASAGEFLTQVPGAARAVLREDGVAPEALAARVRSEVEALRGARKGLQADVAVEGDRVVLTTRGTAVHTSVAEQGHNALWDLAAVAARLPLARGGLEALLATVATQFDGDLHGARLALAYADPFMGPLLVVPSVLRVKDGQATLGINLRAPRGRTARELGAALTGVVERLHEGSGGLIREAPGRYIGEAHAADTSGPLVTTLLDIYRRHRGEPDAAPKSVRGGTYARLFPRAVDFGPGLPGETYAGHAPDESMSLEHLRALSAMLADALHALALQPAPAGKPRVPAAGPGGARR